MCIVKIFYYTKWPLSVLKDISRPIILISDITHCYVSHTWLH